MWQTLTDYIVEYILRIREYGLIKVGAELVLIGLVLYLVWLFLQGTRGSRLMRGLIVTFISVFLIVDVLAERLDLERINVLFQPLVYMIFFGALIVFQPELRRALMQLGEASWIRRFIRETHATTTPIVSAAKYLADHRIGAIIAIERQVALGAVTESGVRLDAAVSSELLRAIFWPGSPLHDMGVVIQEGRVVAAACQFPLTESDRLDPSLGSRHRAAVGLTEDSDAVVIVVSEETGSISLAVGGKLYRGLTPEALDQDLQRLLHVATEGEGKSAALGGRQRP